MVEIRKTDAFKQWIDGLADLKGRARILARIDRMALGNPGDVKAVGEGVTEMRIDFGPGYRVYFTKVGKAIILLLCGGDKSSQAKDIALAKKRAAQVRA